MRRAVSFIAVAALLLAAGWTVWSLRGAGRTAADPWSAIPARSLAVIVVPEVFATWDRATHTTTWWTAFEQLPEAAAFGRVMTRAHQGLENDERLRAAMPACSLLVALMRTGSDRTGCLWVLSTGGRAGPEQLLPLFGGEATLATALRNGGTGELRPDTGLAPLHVAWREGLWMASAEAQVLEEALLQVDGDKPITADSTLRAALRSLGGGADAHVVARSPQAQRLLHGWWPEETLADMDAPTGWLALDVRARSEALLFSGLLHTTAGQALPPALSAQGQGRHSLARVLPAAVHTLRTQHIGDPRRWLRDHAGEQAVDDTLAATLFAWVDGGIGTAVSGSPEESGVLRWALCTAGDPHAAAEALNGVCGGGCDTVRYRGHRLVRLPFDHAHERLLGPAFAGFKRPWWTVLGDVVLFSEDQTALRASVDVWNDGGSLAEDGRTQDWWSTMGGSTARMVHCDVGRARPYLLGQLRPEARQRVERDAGPWNAAGEFTLHLVPGTHGPLHITVGLRHRPAERVVGGTLWSTGVGATVQRPPEVVRNHVNGTREVLVQDTRHRLHLLSSAGKVLWTRELDGPIMGAVEQVDRFRNDKLQLVFNTAGQVYLIDRNGRDVTGFPLHLPARASAPIAVLDYDGARDYRILVPLEDGRVLNHGPDGKAVEGWASPKLSKASTNAAHHLRIKNRDHLLVIDGSGVVHLLDRRGTARERSDLDLGEGAMLLHVVPATDLGSVTLIWRDREGAVQEGDLSGRSATLLPAMPGKAGADDLDGDGTVEVWRIHGDSLHITSGGRTQLERTFAPPVADARTVDLGRGNKGLALAMPGAGRVTVLDMAGRESPGLPRNGQLAPVLADLDLDGLLELVTALEDGTVITHRLAIPAP